MGIVVARFAVWSIVGSNVADAFAVFPPLSASIDTMQVAEAIMVTVEMDFGPKVKTIAEALAQIDRRYTPDDGKGRTFAILDAYGERLSSGKIHMSMHVSTEKAGAGELVFRRTGEILWKCHIMQGEKRTPVVRNLKILIDDDSGKSLILDGSKNPASILEAKIQGSDLHIRDIWREGEMREIIFIYSACGCPVKVKAKRVGERTVRADEMPVIFPDDPGALLTIKRLMKW